MVGTSNAILTKTASAEPPKVETLGVVTNYLATDLNAGGRVPRSAKRIAWSGAEAMRFLRDWIINAREAGVVVDVWDARPESNEFRLAVVGWFYCAEHGTTTRGNECGFCSAQKPQTENEK